MRPVGEGGGGEGGVGSEHMQSSILFWPQPTFPEAGVQERELGRGLDKEKQLKRNQLG